MGEEDEERVKKCSVDRQNYEVLWDCTYTSLHSGICILFLGVTAMHENVKFSLPPPKRDSHSFIFK